MILVVFLIIVVLILIWHFTTKKYIAWGQLNFFMGKKRSGKSTLKAKDEYENLIKGIPVYSTDPISFTVYDKKTDKKKTFRSIPIDPRHIYDYSFPFGSVVEIDEVSLIWDNRNFKSMDPKVVEWFRYQGHYGVKVNLYSQSFDIDKKLRDLVDNFYVVNKFARIFSVATHLIRKPVVVHPLGDAPSSIQDDFIEDPKLLKFLFGSKIIFLPKWFKLFDSFQKPTDFSNNIYIQSLNDARSQNEDGMSDTDYYDFDVS